MKTTTRNQSSRITSALTSLGVSRFTSRSSYAKYEAQNNLQGITHYADDSTLKYFGARIVWATLPGIETEKGLLLAMVESLSNPEDNNTKRGVVFDCFGTVLHRTEFYRTKEQAKRAAWSYINELDIYSHYKATIGEKVARMRIEATRASKAMMGRV